jgi:hypothetical protein
VGVASYLSKENSLMMHSVFDSVLTMNVLGWRKVGWALVLLLGLVLIAILVTGCQPVTAPEVISSLPSDSSAETQWAMVPISDIQESALATDTLILGQLQSPQDHDNGLVSAPAVILGRASAFPTLPDNAVALLPKDEVSEYGNLSLSQSWNLGDDQVLVVVGSDDIPWDVASANGDTVASVSPSHVGRISESGVLDVYPWPGSLEVGIRVPIGTDPIAETIDPIQWFCILCGCCEPIPEMYLPVRPQETDELVLAPLSSLDPLILPPKYWVLSSTGSEKAPLELRPNSFFETLPVAGFALVEKGTLPHGLESVGDLFMGDLTSVLPYSGRFLLDSGRVLTDSVTFATETSLFSFDLIYGDGLGKDPNSVLHLEAVCPECDIDDYCRIDPIGCICMYTPICDMKEIND